MPSPISPDRSDKGPRQPAVPHHRATPAIGYLQFHGIPGVNEMAFSDINMLIASGGGFPNIGNAFAEGREEGRICNALAFASQNYATNPQAAANALMSIGDVRGAQSIMENVRQAEQQRLEAGALADYRRQRLALDERRVAAEEKRINKPDETVYDQRIAAAGKFGLQPGTPEYDSFVLYGKAPEAEAGAFPGQGAEVAG